MPHAFLPIKIPCKNKRFWKDEDTHTHTRTLEEVENRVTRLYLLPGGSHCGYREVTCISAPFKDAVQREDSEAGIR